jgi:hypothetical protein
VVHDSDRVTIGALPEDVLLDIFDFCGGGEMDYYWWMPRGGPIEWQTLVHVCQKWRYLVFASPNRLGLFLVCTDRTSVPEMLHIWPPLPILVSSNQFDAEDNVIAALEHRDRVHRIHLKLTSPQVGRLATAMRGPFPALTHLSLVSDDTTLPVLPDTLSGGSAPRLQSLVLWGIEIPGLPELLLSSSDLVYLNLWQMSNTGYILPEAVVPGLSALTRLRHLSIGFRSWAPRPAQHPSPLIRAVLPSLTDLSFHGGSEYLEDLVARIDAPELHGVFIAFSTQLIFDIRQLPQFICNAKKLRSFKLAEVTFRKDSVKIGLHPRGVKSYSSESATLDIRCRGLQRQVRSMSQICNQFSSLLSSVEQLDILNGYHDLTLQANVDNTGWLELFRSFAGVRTLRISRNLQSLIVSALQEFTGQMTKELLPALDSLYLQEYEPSGSEEQVMEPFITARQWSGHHLAIHRFDVSPVLSTCIPHHGTPIIYALNG